MNILIKQGRVLDPASKTDKVMDVLIKDGFVASMEENIDESQADDVIDASGCMVMPGLVDLNAHFRDYKNRFKSCSKRWLHNCVHDA